MNNREMLSQDEIDALLNGKEDEVLAKHLGENSNSPLDEHLSSIEQDALGEMGNISFGNSATALSTLLNQKVEITTPKVTLVKSSELANEFPQPHVAVRVNYTEGFSGVNLLVVKFKDAAIIADLMLGGDGTQPEEIMNEIHLSAVQEAMNQMMGSAATSMSSIFNKRIDISPPEINILDVNSGKGVEYIPKEECFVKVSFNLKVGNLIDSDIMQLLPINFAKELVHTLLHSNPMEPEQSKVETAPLTQEKVSSNNVQTESIRNHSTAQQEHTTINKPAVSVQPVAFTEFEEPNVQLKERQNLDLLLDIPLQVSVELGRTKKTIKEILELGSGSIIELDKLAGEPVDIHINGKLIAKGEVVVIEENFGVRITDIISRTERIMKLK
jgi:flagellar motor switch protein FliN